MDAFWLALPATLAAILAALLARETRRRKRETARIRRKLANATAHGLATPLTPIKVQTHLLLAGSFGPLNEAQQRAVGVIARNADQLGEAVREVLDAAR